MSGYEQPNYTQAPNAFFDKVLKDIDSMSELKVTLAVIRHTMGFHRDEHELSLSYLVEYTGLTRETVVDGLKRAMKRGSVSRRPSGQSFAYSLKVVGKPDHLEKPSSRKTGPLSSRKTGPKKESKKESNDKSNDLSANGEENSPMPMGQFGMKELAERVKAAREQGAVIHSTTDRERKDFGAMFKRAAQDGHELDHLLLALDYMVAKASGELENEPKAWCGFRTALDRVIEGWRPKKPTHLKVVDGKALKERAELDAEWADILKDVG